MAGHKRESVKSGCGEDESEAEMDLGKRPGLDLGGDCAGFGPDLCESEEEDVTVRPGPRRFLYRCRTIFIRSSINIRKIGKIADENQILRLDFSMHQL